MSNKTFSTSLVLLLLTFLAVSAMAYRHAPVVVRTKLEGLPMTISGYSGTEDFLPGSVYAALKADKSLYRHYRNRNGDQVDVYIGYYGTAKGGRTGHNPYACLPSAGWAIVESGKVGVRPSYYMRGGQINYVVASKDGANDVMVHWYQSAGTHIMSTGLQQNVQRFVGRIFNDRDDGAYVQVSSITGEQERPLAKERVVAFAKNVLELLPAYWPEER
jgi:EpsI family protein